MKRWFWKFLIKHINVSVSSIYGDIYKCNMYMIAVRQQFRGLHTPDNIIFLELADNHKLVISLDIKI